MIFAREDEAGQLREGRVAELFAPPEFFAVETFVVVPARRRDRVVLGRKGLNDDAPGLAGATRAACARLGLPVEVAERVKVYGKQGFDGTGFSKTEKLIFNDIFLIKI